MEEACHIVAHFAADDDDDDCKSRFGAVAVAVAVVVVDDRAGGVACVNSDKSHGHDTKRADKMEALQTASGCSCYNSPRVVQPPRNLAYMPPTTTTTSERRCIDSPE